MRTITRYVVWDLLKVFGLLLVGLTLVVMVILVGQQALRMNLGLWPTLRVAQFILPQALAFAVPAAILFAVCFVYGRMSADNEVTAIKALGISPTAVLWPGCVLALVLSLWGVWLNDLAFSWGHMGVQKVVLQSAEEIAYRLLRAQHTYSNNKFSILVQGVENRALIRPIMNFQPNNDMPAFTLTAERAELRSNLDRSTLSVIVTNFEIESGGILTMRDPGTRIEEIPLSYASAKEARTDSPSHLPLSQIAAAAQDQQQLIAEIEDSQAGQAGFNLLRGDFDALSSASWQGQTRRLDEARERLYRLQTEPWRRWAGGFSCLCFVLVGAPLAVRMRNSDYLTTFAVCFGPILLCYYPLFAYGLEMAKSGQLPPYVVWAANIVCAAIGLWLLRSVVRH
ncbi:MAG TPA: LptF/LptG family permease [Pirellulaceae bacterium]|jgi:lipopolysaccharide export system permease protein|nr:LptF/LptG family permease [Pirellulaceae bacterium]